MHSSKSTDASYFMIRLGRLLEGHEGKVGEPGKLGMVEVGCELRCGAHSVRGFGRVILRLQTIDTGRVSV